jgi:hypothetical protein
MTTQIHDNLRHLQRAENQSLSFIICTEQGSLEQKSILFAMTLRTFGGALASAPIISFQPRLGYEISAKTKKIFNKLNVEHIEIPFNKDYIEYPQANKPLVCAYCEKNLDSEILVFADSDQVIVNEPSELLLPKKFDVGVRPVDLKGIGACEQDDSNYPFWEKLYSLLGVHSRYYVHTSIENSKILGYWNVGLVAVRRDKGIFTKWEENFHKVMQKGLVPKQGIFFLEQAVFAATVAQINASVFSYSKGYNYPINLQDSLREELKVDLLTDMTTIHYHQLFTTRSLKHPLSNFFDDNNNDKKNLIFRQIDSSGVYPKTFIKRVIWLFKRALKKSYKQLMRN